MTAQDGTEDRGPDTEMRTWWLFGFRLASDHPFVTPLLPASGEPDVTLRSVAQPPLPPGWEETPLSYASPAMIDERQPFLTILVLDACAVFRFTEVVDFFVFRDRVLWRLLDPAYAYMVELHFLGLVMAYWLERRGLPAIHGAAVQVGDGAIGFLATGQGGKSSLAAGFLQAGHALLTDDILAIERPGGRCLARPSYPQMRMWPDQARHVLGRVEGLERVHPTVSKLRVPVGAHGLGRFTNVPLPLSCLYLPERRDGGEVSFAPLPFAEAVVALARLSFLSDIIDALGLHRSRFAALAGIARTLPIRRVAFPEGLARLPDAVRAIADDARSH
jgi:hypothetical protein